MELNRSHDWNITLKENNINENESTTDNILKQQITSYVRTIQCNICNREMWLYGHHLVVSDRMGPQGKGTMKLIAVIGCINPNILNYHNIPHLT